MRSRYLFRMIQLFVLAGLLGCGDNLSTAQDATSCSSGTAQIAVGDGYLEVLCGCTEANGTIVVPPSVLTCHVSAPSTAIVFAFVGTTLQHQIVSTSGPGFASSSLYDPQAAQPISSYSATLSTSGTYGFQDQVNAQMTGEIIVP